MSSRDIIVLIDMDGYLHRACHAVEKVAYKFIHNNGYETDFTGWGLRTIRTSLKENGLTPEEGKLVKVTDPGSFGLVAHILKSSIKSTLENTLATSYKMVISPSDRSNFRYRVYPKYKEARKDPKPAHYNSLKQYLVNKYKVDVAVEQEADDSLGIMATWLQEHNIMAIIASNDKDMNQIAAHHYDPVKKEMYETTEFGSLELNEKRDKLIGGGLLFSYTQMIMGDSTDSIPGLPKHGPVTVYELLKDATTEDELLRIVYDAYGGDRLNQFCITCDLVWIRRYQNEVKSNDIRRRINEY